MRLERVKIKNFRSIKSIDLEMPDSNILVLVGSNNAGKSNIIRAIDAVCGDSWFGPAKMEDHDYYRREKSTFLIRLTFDDGRYSQLSPQEQWPTTFTRHGDKLYKDKIKDIFPCTYLGADRTLDKHLAFYDGSLLGRIRKEFHRRASASIDASLREKFEELSRLFDKVPGFEQFKRDFSRFFDQMQADAPVTLDIDFKPFTPSNYFKNMHVVAEDPNQGSSGLDLAELGEGSRNTVLLALMRSYALHMRGSGESVQGVLAIEEPELFLHPQARRHLYSVLTEIAESGIQVILSTHSASFVDTERFDSIARVYKVPDEDHDAGTHTSIRTVSKRALVARCIETGVPHAKVTEDSISEFYSTTSNYRLNEGFFARYLLLVEGDTEELALPEYLARAGVDCDLLGVSVVGVSGKNQLPKYWRLFSSFGIPIGLVFDNDPASPGSNKNICACFKLDEADLLFFTGVFTTLSTRLAPDMPVVVLDGDFETAIERDALASGISQERLKAIEHAALDAIKPLKGQCKGQVARFVARKLLQEHPDYCPSFVRVLADRIRDTLGATRQHRAASPAIRLDDIPF